MELAKHFIRTNIVPVLPPELRLIIEIDTSKLMSLDMNKIYRRIILGTIFLVIY